MGWRDKIGPEARQHIHDLGETDTKHTEPPVPGEKEPQSPSFVCSVSNFQKSKNSNADPSPFQIGEKSVSEKKKERVPQANPNDWLDAWRNLATMTQDIQETDWRFKAVLDLLNLCDKAFEAGSWTAFQRLAEKTNMLCQKK